MATLSLDTLNAINGSGTAGSQAANAANAASTADRFLRLLVTQMQNQDPLNPMDNAQVTSQMAQINTVSGIDKLNTTVQGLNSQFVQMQALQGASLVGRSVTLQGDRLDVQAGQGVAGFDLAGTASEVKVEVLNAAGRVVDTLNLGAQTAGRHAFNWTAPAGSADGASYRFRVTARAGASAVSHTSLMRDHVQSVSLAGDRLELDTLYSGRIDYAAVRAVN
jgi:flagellar basal-body rod modification protein FlgD